MQLNSIWRIMACLVFLSRHQNCGGASLFCSRWPERWTPGASKCHSSNQALDLLRSGKRLASVPATAFHKRNPSARLRAIPILARTNLREVRDPLGTPTTLPRLAAIFRCRSFGAGPSACCGENACSAHA